jgi:hypothetical protein
MVLDFKMEIIKEGIFLFLHHVKIGIHDCEADE